MSQGTKVPGLGKTIIDPDQVLDLIDQMRISVPKELQEARRLLEERDQVVEQARRDSEAMLASARQEIEGRLQMSDIVRLAQERADEVIGQAQRQGERVLADADQEAATLRREAEQYYVDVLRKLVGQIGSTQSNLEKAIEQMVSATNPVS